MKNYRRIFRTTICAILIVANIFMMTGCMTLAFIGFMDTEPEKTDTTPTTISPNITLLTETEEEIVYKQIELNKLAEAWFWSNNPSDIAYQYIDSYIEFDMSEYVYEWIKSITDQYLFTTFLGENYNGNTWNGYIDAHLQIKFRSIYDVQEIMNAELGWDKIIVRGKIRSFNENGILIEGIDVVDITLYEN